MYRGLHFVKVAAAAAMIMTTSVLGQSALAGIWKDTATGQVVPSAPYLRKGEVVATVTGANIRVNAYAVAPSPGDPNRAYDPVTGRNFVRDACGNWRDTEVVPVSGTVWRLG